MRRHPARSLLRSSRLLRVLVASAVAVLVPLGGAASLDAAQADGQARAVGRPTYLALGDSVAFGYRPGAVTTPAQYADPTGFVGYPEVLSGRYHVPVVNASCPGETTTSFLDASAQSNGCENSVGSPIGYRDLYPLHVDYAGSQLDFAVDYLRTHRHTGLVTIDIGANDLFLCQRTTASHCTSPADFGALLQRIRTNTDTILRALREDAGYDGRLVLLSYYSTDYTDPATTTGIATVNDALAAAARANEALVADGFAAMQQASLPTGQPCTAGLLIALPTGGCDVHPTRAGHEALADAVAAVAPKAAVASRR
jgi:lysophospholipase L1-like esterase